MKLPDVTPSRVRRSRQPVRGLSPQRFLNSVLFSSLDDPWKTVRLERNVLTDYCQRPVSLKPSLAEFYHENSKLCAQALAERPHLDVPLDVFRQEFIQRRRAVLETMQFSTLDLPVLHDEAVAVAGRTVGRDVWYAIELRALFEGLLGDYEPLSSSFRVVKELAADDTEKLLSSVNPLGPTTVGRPSEYSLLLVIGSFARNEALYGIRGYRRTLIEAGRLIESLLETANELGLAADVSYDFIDSEVDRVMEADGTEQGTLAAISLHPMMGGASNVDE
jgi:hypothetical protein